MKRLALLAAVIALACAEPIAPEVSGLPPRLQTMYPGCIRDYSYPEDAGVRWECSRYIDAHNIAEGCFMGGQDYYLGEYDTIWEVFCWGW